MRRSPDRQAPHRVGGKRRSAHVDGLYGALRRPLAPHAHHAVVAPGVEVARLEPSHAPLHGFKGEEGMEGKILEGVER